jgi:hypothetical protein
VGSISQAMQFVMIFLSPVPIMLCAARCLTGHDFIQRLCGVRLRLPCFMTIRLASDLASFILRTA